MKIPSLTRLNSATLPINPPSSRLTPTVQYTPQFGNTGALDAYFKQAEGEEYLPLENLQQLQIALKTANPTWVWETEETGVKLEKQNGDILITFHKYDHPTPPETPQAIEKGQATLKIRVNDTGYIVDSFRQGTSLLEKFGHPVTRLNRFIMDTFNAVQVESETAQALRTKLAPYLNGSPELWIQPQEGRPFLQFLFASEGTHYAIEVSRPNTVGRLKFLLKTQDKLSGKFIEHAKLELSPENTIQNTKWCDNTKTTKLDNSAGYQMLTAFLDENAFDKQPVLTLPTNTASTTAPSTPVEPEPTQVSSTRRLINSIIESVKNYLSAWSWILPRR